MKRERLLYVGQAIADELYDGVEENLDRYSTSGFGDLVAGGGWSIPLRIEYDRDALHELNPGAGADVEIENSRIVWKALRALTPALAQENRIWVRLSHVECVDYCRSRLVEGSNDESKAKTIRRKMFATSRTGARDDHSIARLWWNGWIANNVWPKDPDAALKLILGRSDVRLNLIERPWIFSRPALAAAILRLFLRHEWPLLEELNYRQVMKELNVMGTGVVFEVMKDSDIDDFLERVMMRAQVVRRVECQQRVAKMEEVEGGS